MQLQNKTLTIHIKLLSCKKGELFYYFYSTFISLSVDISKNILRSAYPDKDILRFLVMARTQQKVLELVLGSLDCRLEAYSYVKFPSSHRICRYLHSIAEAHVSDNIILIIMVLSSF